MLHCQVRNPSVHIVGAGGTGSYTALFLARLLAGTTIPIHLYDGDLVELKNLKRQQFDKQFIGSYKTDAIKHQLEQTILGCPPVYSHPEYLVDIDEFAADLVLSDTVPIVISCVDNVATRKLLNAVLDRYYEDDNAVFIDSGNNDLGGQVVWSATFPITYTSAFQAPQTVRLKRFLDVYPDLLTIDDDNPGVVTNCAEVSEDYPQAMMANVKNAEIIANLVFSLVESQPIAYNVIESVLGGNTVGTIQTK